VNTFTLNAQHLTGQPSVVPMGWCMQSYFRI